MDPTLSIALLWIGFTATHLGLASLRVEPVLRGRLGDTGFLAFYSAVALAFFVPLVWVYFDHRHAGAWLWQLSVGSGLRAVLYLAMGLAVLVVVAGASNPSPASIAPGSSEVRGVYRITRHPVVIGTGMLMALHLVANGSSADLAFFGGFVLFAVLGAWHQDGRKLATAGDGFRRFHAETSFLPFARAGAWRGLLEVSPLAWGVSLLAVLGIRWLHPLGIWPH